MRHSFKVQIEDKHGNWQPILYTNDESVARLTVDTREPNVSSQVIDADGNVIYSNEDSATVDVGMEVARV